jgi:uncharacterized protein with GYD domain
MPTYILLSTLTDEGAATLKYKPGRLKEVNEELKELGALVKEQYAVLGPYDFVNIVEAPDNETIARVSIELSARGSIRILTLPAVPIDDFIDSLS